jgi:hypothetical protein
MADAVLQSATWVLNEPGSINYSFSPISKASAYPKENINEVQLWIDDQWAHQAIHMKRQSKPNESSLNCPGLLEYFNYRYILNGSLLYPTTEQMTIAADLIYKAQHIGAGQDWNILVDTYVASGLARSLNYPRDQHQNFLSVLKQFNTYADSVGNPTGFDFDIVWKSDTHRYFKMYYPRKGIVQFNTVLEWGKNITNYVINTDGTQMANRVYVTGGSNGDIKYENNYQDDPSRATYGEWQGVKSAGSEVDVTVLYALAARQVAQRKAPLVLPDLTVVEVPDALLGVVSTGDIVRCMIDNGSDQINGSYRIIEITWKPGPGNLQLKLAVPAV